MECGGRAAALARVLWPHQRTSQSGGFATALYTEATSAHSGSLSKAVVGGGQAILPVRLSSPVDRELTEMITQAAASAIEHDRETRLTNV